MYYFFAEKKSLTEDWNSIANMFCSKQANNLIFFYDKQIAYSVLDSYAKMKKRLGMYIQAKYILKIAISPANYWRVAFQPSSFNPPRKNILAKKWNLIANIKIDRDYFLSMENEMDGFPVYRKYQFAQKKT